MRRLFVFLSLLAFASPASAQTTALAKSNLARWNAYMTTLNAYKANLTVANIQYQQLSTWLARNDLTRSQRQTFGAMRAQTQRFLEPPASLPIHQVGQTPTTYISHVNKMLADLATTDKEIALPANANMVFVPCFVDRAGRFTAHTFRRP